MSYKNYPIYSYWDDENKEILYSSDVIIGSSENFRNFNDALCSADVIM